MGRDLKGETASLCNIPDPEISWVHLVPSVTYRGRHPLHQVRSAPRGAVAQERALSLTLLFWEPVP